MAGPGADGTPRPVAPRCRSLGPVRSGSALPRHDRPGGELSVNAVAGTGWRPAGRHVGRHRCHGARAMASAGPLCGDARRQPPQEVGAQAWRSRTASVAAPQRVPSGLSAVRWCAFPPGAEGRRERWRAGQVRAGAAVMQHPISSTVEPGQAVGGESRQPDRLVARYVNQSRVTRTCCTRRVRPRSSSGKRVEAEDARGLQRHHAAISDGTPARSARSPVRGHRPGGGRQCMDTWKEGAATTSACPAEYDLDERGCCRSKSEAPGRAGPTHRRRLVILFEGRDAAGGRHHKRHGGRSGRPPRRRR